MIRHTKLHRVDITGEIEVIRRPNSYKWMERFQAGIYLEQQHFLIQQQQQQFIISQQQQQQDKATRAVIYATTAETTATNADSATTTTTSLPIIIDTCKYRRNLGMRLKG